jgi:hypothetical protein
MNPVLSQLPKAQEAYVNTVKNWSDVDTTPILLEANKLIQGAVQCGNMAFQIPNLVDIRAAEKAALELQELGYSTTVVHSGMAPDGQGGFKPLAAIQVNWKYMPANIRDTYTV